MYIANPMYDTVFKFLLEDNALAKLLIGAIIQEEIVTLEFRPQERTSQIGHRGLRLLTVYRVDFAARVRNAAGEERLVLIELQKAKYPTDILRFRRYLGEQYRSPDNTCEHDSYIIQIPKLHSPHRSEVEAMLQLFDQRRIHGDRHRLEIEESEIPERYRPLLRRLQRAVVEPEIADAMDVEDEVLAEMQDMERAVERERAEKEKERAEKEKERAEKEKERAEKEKERAEKEKERAEKERLLALLKQAGIDPEARS